MEELEQAKAVLGYSAVDTKNVQQPAHAELVLAAQASNISCFVSIPRLRLT